jgi:hypothetical protein
LLLLRFQKHGLFQRLLLKQLEPAELLLPLLQQMLMMPLMFQKHWWLLL